ncbi:Putative protease slr0021 [Geodia barretti]|uniref:Protease slr0021 n=1 Tax=Geodia barretti TaxID=519541 RepID=A0AA35WEP2_GEOBA|nr:Putative protease slr0021 [Geodia barretti]
MPRFFRFRRAGSVAVIEIHGAIGTRIRESVYSRLFADVAANKRYRALLLDIQSPGGSAAGSELLYHSLRKVAAQKPVVAHIRSLGASGGYYLACAAHRVTALPTTMVGSIGVIHLRPVLEQLLGRAGIEFAVVKGGRLKDMGGFWRGPTEEESENLQAIISEVYDNFVAVVASGRSMEQDQVRELATGELFTARRGKELGLVDDLVDFEESLEMAGQLAGIDRNKARPKWLRPHRSMSERLTGRPASQAAGLSLLGPDLQRLMAGGLYYLDPSALLGSPEG